MKINLMVTGPLYSAQSSYSALQFCWAAIAQDCTISQVFFYQDGVGQGNGFSQTLSDEFDAVAGWRDFADQTGTQLIVCVSAMERRLLHHR